MPARGELAAEAAKDGHRQPEEILVATPDLTLRPVRAGTAKDDGSAVTRSDTSARSLVQRGARHIAPTRLGFSTSWYVRASAHFNGAPLRRPLQRGERAASGMGGAFARDTALTVELP